MLIQGPGQQGLSQTVICKQAGASLIIVTGTSKDTARLEVARKLGADHVIDVQKEDPLARIKEITGGKGVDVVLDCTAGAGTIPILLGVEALKRKAGTMVVQGEMAEFPNFPIGRVTVKYITIKSARGHSFKACELALAAARLEALPAGAGDDPPVRAQGRRPRHPVGGRRGRAGRDSRVADAVGVSHQPQSDKSPSPPATRPASGPEISLKAALDPAVRGACDPIVVSDPAVLARHAEACGIEAELRVVERIGDADWSDQRTERSRLRGARRGRASLRRQQRGERARLTRLLRRRHQCGACRRGRRRGRGAAERDLDRACRHPV